MKASGRAEAATIEDHVREREPRECSDSIDSTAKQAKVHPNRMKAPMLGPRCLALTQSRTVRDPEAIADMAMGRARERNHPDLPVSSSRSQR